MRRVEAEWLDDLPADNPRAVRARRDLVRVNAWMGHAGIMARMLVAHAPRAPRTILDLGAGDGSFMLRLARRLATRWPGVTVMLLDRQDIVRAQTRLGFAELGWRAESIAMDAVEFLGKAPPVDVITANLFLHHLDDEPLRRLLAAAAARASLFAVCEPRRAPLAQLGSRLLWAIGCNDVSRHDAVVSVRAGFRDSELSALWPSKTGWVLAESAAGLFTHRFAARRVESAP